jgi:hypothetical protein
MKEYLVNSRVNHGLICSGILPSDYKRFANGTGIGIINDDTEASFSKISCFLSSLPDISIRKHNFFRY